MADLHPVAGAKFYIGDQTDSQIADFVAADFAAHTWVEVDGWETSGVVGDAAALIVTPLINRRRDVKQKGTRNAGSMQNNFAVITGDPGQQDMEDAEKGPLNYAFRVVYDDMPSGGTNGTTKYFVGLVTTWQETGGGANTPRLNQGVVEINSNVVTVPAA